VSGVLCKVKLKFPPFQKIHISKKWGFTKFNTDEFEDMVAEKQLISNGCNLLYEWQALNLRGVSVWCSLLTQAHQ
jgi:hypothetical protein